MFTCQNGEFTTIEGATECQICPVSRIDFNGWYCMTDAQKLVFAGGWILSIFSISATLWKINQWIKHRKRKLIENNIPITLKNIIFYKKPNSFNLIERNNSIDERLRYIEEMIMELKSQKIEYKNT